MLWCKNISDQTFEKYSAAEQAWATQNFIQIKALHEVDFLIHELTKRLKDLGIEETRGAEKLILAREEEDRILRIVIAGACYPDYFFFKIKDDDDKAISKELNGFDPCQTVFLKGWDRNVNGELYAKRIQELFQEVVPSSWQEALVRFDDCSQKVYVTFADNNDDNISHAVYKALQMRKLQTIMQVKVLNKKSTRRVNYQSLYDTFIYII